MGTKTPGNRPLPNTLIHRATPLITPNGIQIQSAVLPQYTDRPTDWQVSKKSAYALYYIDSE